MNFLAHLYLSGDDPDIKIGNFIGDFVKGKNQLQNLPEGIQRGVVLHRSIDEFTDRHPIVIQSRKRLWSSYRHYSSVILDIFFDHFLAKNWDSYHDTLLPDYAEACYLILEKRKKELPIDVQLLLPHMMRDNWLVNYSRIEGIHRALKGMARRAKFDSKMDESIHDLKEQYADFEKDFRTFFPHLRTHAEFSLEVL
jgi:acyl carrier protein phosphodiesterase